MSAMLRRGEAHLRKFKMAAVEVAKFYGASGVGEWDDLPDFYKKFLLDNVPYDVLIQPLVWRDRGNGLSWRQMSNKYGVSVQTVRTVCKRAYLCGK